MEIQKVNTKAFNIFLNTFVNSLKIKMQNMQKIINNLFKKDMLEYKNHSFRKSTLTVGLSGIKESVSMIINVFSLIIGLILYTNKMLDIDEAIIISQMSLLIYLMIPKVKVL